MYTYQLKTELAAVSREQNGGAAKVVKLGPGTIVRLPESEAEQHPNGLVKVIVGEAAFSVFMPDIESHGERIVEDAN